MNKLNLQFSLIGLFFIPTIFGYTTNTVINVGLYENYNDCISQTNILYTYKQSFDITCNCFLDNDCYNKLTESDKFKTYFFNYDNYNIYLDELKFKDQCYRFTILSGKTDIYIYNEMTFYQRCGGLIVVSSLFIISIIIFIVIINTKTKKKGILLIDEPPLYQSTI
jgi:hypothetical protein